MDTTRFDRITRLFTARREIRRQATSRAAGTPAASPKSDATGNEPTPYLFVQSFQSGTLTPNDGYDRHTLTLEQGLGETVYFADRPSRDAGVISTGPFLDGLGFPADNPPNAALVVDMGDEETEIAVLELFDPAYDIATRTATYTVRALEAWDSSADKGFHQSPSDLSTLSGSLGASHLFIDDCPDDAIHCQKPYYGNQMEEVGSFADQAFCWNYGLCIPCQPYGHDQPDRNSVVDYWSAQCNADYPACDGNCVGHFTNRCALAGC